ncbi:uncharacterized protein LOC108674250 [Hyalella azteca]|uniref:Uncharacterized protein LOC108674250 n=1 Tax=Hyalella azteca TaxID=294128 RepID=A0A8B7NVC8_HYAAZ|nr:uncharacterized protein LOC108674250 [Hyalella azteca]
MATESCSESSNNNQIFLDYSAKSSNFLSGSYTLLLALQHIHRGLKEENHRLPKSSLKTHSIVIGRHEEVLLKVIQLLKSYAMNFIDFHVEYLELHKCKDQCNGPARARARSSRKSLILQRDAILHCVDKIVLCQLRFMSQHFSESSDSFKGENVFKVIRCYNAILEKLKLCSEADFELEEEKPRVQEENVDLNAPSTSSLSVPSTKKRQSEPPPAPPPIEKIKIRLTPEPMVAPSSQLKKFTASRILQSVGSVRCGYVTEYIAEALLSRIDVPVQNGHSPKMNLPWKPVSFGSGISGKSHFDIFEEALAKEEDENRLNQKKLDMALRQEFGEDFPGTDYLPDSECGDALKPLSSSNMARLIKTNTALLQLLFKKFINTPGVLVPSLVKFGRYGEHRLSKAGRTRLEGYYVDQIWGVGSNLVDELLLWSPLMVTQEHGTGARGAAIPGVRGTDRPTVMVASTNDETGEGILTPASQSSTGSSASTNTVISSSRNARESLCLRPSTQAGRVTRFRTLSFMTEGRCDTSTFFAPPALNNNYLLYLQDALQKYSRRGVLPGWCVEASECLITECGHLVSQSCLDRSLTVALGAYARRQPPPVHLSDGNFSTGGGVGFSSALEQLVWQVNQVEKTEPETEEKDWPIAELIESLSVLCSVCSSGLCLLQLRSQSLLHTWTTAPYYLLTQADLPHIIAQFNKIIMEEREYLVKTDVLQRALLVPYREKLVARTQALLAYAKRQECGAVEAVSEVCRTVALAHLQNAMPKPPVWRGVGRLPHEPHPYVAEYIGSVLQPVLDAVSQLGEQLQRRAGSAVLKVVCYAWLEHIRVQKIKFSLWGAQQLLKDFAALSEWVQSYPGLCAGAREQVLAVDVLRECEGVARLLMRQPPLVVGYSSLNQVAPLTTIKAGREHDKAVRLGGEREDIPAEMYVPNQTVWLGRRTRPSSSVCVRSAACCSWPY